MREITEAARQRNVSALTYHFGSREGVLAEILRTHGDPADLERGKRLVEPAEAMTTRDLVGTLLVPYAGSLATPSGRDYLRIVAQLTDRFPEWRAEGPLSPPNLRRILGILQDRAGGDARERVVYAVMLITSAMAERARLLEEGGDVRLGEGAFLANLADVLVAGIEAPASPTFQA